MSGMIALIEVQVLWRVSTISKHRSNSFTNDEISSSLFNSMLQLSMIDQNFRFSSLACSFAWSLISSIRSISMGMGLSLTGEVYLVRGSLMQKLQSSSKLFLPGVFNMMRSFSSSLSWGERVEQLWWLWETLACSSIRVLRVSKSVCLSQWRGLCLGLDLVILTLCCYDNIIYSIIIKGPSTEIHLSESQSQTQYRLIPNIPTLCPSHTQTVQINQFTRVVNLKTASQILSAIMAIRCRKLKKIGTVGGLKGFPPMGYHYQTMSFLIRSIPNFMRQSYVLRPVMYFGGKPEGNTYPPRDKQEKHQENDRGVNKDGQHRENDPTKDKDRHQENDKNNRNKDNERPKDHDKDKNNDKQRINRPDPDIKRPSETQDKRK